jgi:imidazolonepropionase
VKPRATLVVRNALVATCDAGPSDAGLVPDGAVAVADRLVAWVGPDADLAAAVDLDGAEVVDAGGRLATPGLVDSHTHLVFAGDRSGELDLRARGLDHGAIAAAGGGISGTVRATRAASREELLGLALRRARRLVAEGVTTVEAKSGYGLTVEHELRLLEVVDELRHALWAELTVVPTLLAAHAVPPEGDRERWLGAIEAELVPEVARRGLARSCDAFAERGAFTLGEARRALEAGLRHGLDARLHADQLSPGAGEGAPGGGAALAAALGCASADHLEHADDAGVAALGRAGVVAGLLPVSTVWLGGHRWAPARRLLEAGVPVAIATNLNPGSAPAGSASLVLGLACARLGLSPAEALVAFTSGGARALRLAHHGRLAAGLEADLVLWGCRSLEHLAGHPAARHALRVVKRGRTVWEAPPGAAEDCA